MTQNPRRDDRDLARRLAELERRLKSLETAPRAGHTSISNGKLLVMDPATGAVIASLAGTDGVDVGGNAYPAGLGAEVGSVNGGVLQPASVDASKVSFTMRDLSGITTTTSDSAPAGPVEGDLWIDTSSGNVLKRYDGAAWASLPVGPDAIQAGAVTASQVAANTLTAAQIAAGGLTAETLAASAIDGKVITGATIITNSSTGGVYIYDGPPAAGNLIVSISSDSGTDAFGNSYPQGLNVFAGTINGATVNASAITAGAISAGSIGDSQIVNSAFKGGTIDNATITFDADGGALLIYASTTTTTTLTTSGSFTVPAGVTSLMVECWGGGGGSAGGSLAGGSNSGGYGGGGGGYSKVNALAVTPGAVLPYVVAAGGVGAAPNNLGTNGGITSFNGTACRAFGGTAATLSATGKGGTAGSGAGDLKFSGGAAGVAIGSGGCGGGSSAGTGSNGNLAADNTGSGSKAGAASVPGGGFGGTGAPANTNGAAGGIPGGGGGGGGGGSSAGAGGAGARGQIRVTYTTGRSLIASISPKASVDAFGNAYPAGIAGKFAAGTTHVTSKASDPTYISDPGIYTSYTAAQWPAIDVVCPPSESIAIMLRVQGYGNVSATSTIRVGVAITDQTAGGASVLAAATTRGASCQTWGNAITVLSSDQHIIGAAGELAGLAGHTLRITPQWRNSNPVTQNTSPVVVSVSSGQLTVEPLINPATSP